MPIKGISKNPDFQNLALSPITHNPKRLKDANRDQHNNTESPSIGPNLRLSRTLFAHFRKRTRRHLGCRRRRTIYRRRHRRRHGRRHTTRNTGSVILGRATGAAAKNALAAKVSLLILCVVELRHLVRVLLPVARVVPGEEIVLDPKDLVDGAHERDLASQRQVRVR